MRFLEEFGMIDEGISLMMLRIRKSIRAALRQAGREEGLSQNEIEVLLFLCHNHLDTARDITQCRGISRSLVSKSVDTLLKRGYIEVRQDEADRRVSHLTLLPKARNIVEKLEQVRREYMETLCRGITREEGEAFMSIVRKMSDNVAELDRFPEEEPEGRDTGRNPGMDSGAFSRRERIGHNL